MSKFSSFAEYPPRSLAGAEAALLTAWASLERLNPALPPEAITAAIDELIRDRSAMLREQANREVYRLLKEGIPVSVADTDSTERPLIPAFALAQKVGPRSGR